MMMILHPEIFMKPTDESWACACVSCLVGFLLRKKVGHYIWYRTVVEAEIYV